MRRWRNRQTHYFEGVASNIVWVQVPSFAPENVLRSRLLLFFCHKSRLFHFYSFAYEIELCNRKKISMYISNDIFDKINPLYGSSMDVLGFLCTYPLVSSLLSFYLYLTFWQFVPCYILSQIMFLSLFALLPPAS